MQIKRINSIGFTLIELLVVIAIIGLLATMAMISLTTSAAKARDAKRLSDVRNISKILSLAASDVPNATLAAPCNVANAIISTCVGAQPGNIASEFPKFNDPSGTGPCNITNPDLCNYTIQNTNATVENAIIMFYLETNMSGLSANTVHTIDASGTIN